jgi:hypothetical protein
MDHARAGAVGDGLGTVRAAVVRHDDFRAEAGFLNRAQGFADAHGQRICLIEAGHHDREFNAVAHSIAFRESCTESGCDAKVDLRAAFMERI